MRAGPVAVLRQEGRRAAEPADASPVGEEVTFRVRGGELRGDLVVPSGARGTVIFAHGSGSGRRSPRNRWVARELELGGIATFLLDLLTREEASVDAETFRYRFDIPRLADRLVQAVDAVGTWPSTAGRPIGLYGASTGGAAALIAGAARPDHVRALVLRGARSDLAGPAASRVRAPTLFLVGELDPEVRALNEETLRAMTHARTELQVVPGATHLFEEPGALEAVAGRTREWFARFFAPPA